MTGASLFQFIKREDFMHRRGGHFFDPPILPAWGWGRSRLWEYYFWLWG